MDQKKDRLEIFLEDIANFDNVIQYLTDQAKISKNNSSFIWANNDQNVQKTEISINNKLPQSIFDFGGKLDPVLKKASSMEQ